MPTLPLYQPTHVAGEPEAWHGVMAPGGYEAWQFIAGDEANDVWVMASLSWGSMSLPSYLRRYERYRRWPTRVKPPAGKDSCCASFAMYERDRTTRFDLCVNGSEFSAGKGAGVRVGANRLTVEADGRLHLHLRGVPWELTGAGPALLRDQTVSANLVFEPSFGGMSREMELMGGVEAPVHRWTVSRPLCRVSGEVSIFNQRPRAVTLSGRGCHDHAWGVRPMAWDFARSIRGAMLGEARAVIFRWDQPRAPGGCDVAHMVSANQTQWNHAQLAASNGQWARGKAMRLRYPRAMQFGKALHIENPKVLGTTLASVTAIYTGHFGDQTGPAVCELVNWNKLRSGVWGRLIELGVGKV